MTTPMEPTPKLPTYRHELKWTDHEKPRWMLATCKRCDHSWPVHITQTGWQPKADCPIAPSGPERGAA